MRTCLGGAIALGVCGLAFACGDDASPAPPITANPDGSTPKDGSTPNDSGDAASTSDDGGVSTGTMTLDPSFTKVVVAGADAGIPPTLNGLVVQADGRIVIAFTPPDAAGSSPASLVRISTTGTLEPAFNVQTNDAYAQLLAGPNGKLVVHGSPTSALGSGDFAQFLSDGTPDSTFGSGGHASSGAGGGVPAVAPDGKLVAGLSGGHIVNRVDATGHLDATFGSPAGFAILTPSTRYAIRAVTALADGRVLAGGNLKDSGGNEGACFVLRLTNAGTVDTAFGGGTNGEASVADDCAAVDALFVTADGGIVVQAQVKSTFALSLVRLSSAGAKDASYAAIDGPSRPGSNALQLADDRLLFLAHARSAGALSVWRTKSTGGANDVRTLPEAWSSPARIALTSDGKLVVAGFLDGALTVARYLP